MIVSFFEILTRAKQAKRILKTVVDYEFECGDIIIDGSTSNVEPPLEQTIYYIIMITEVHFQSVHQVRNVPFEQVMLLASPSKIKLLGKASSR